MHLHILLYERKYDSLQTSYALDTILAIIETWPSNVLYSMATSTLSNNSLSTTNAFSIFDGTRRAQIKALYQRHQNSMHGEGFYHNDNGLNNSIFSDELFPSKKYSQEMLEDNFNNSSILELIVQICLQYLRSYYPSCPATDTVDDSMHKNINSDFGKLFMDKINTCSMNQCIDLEAIYGNQRVRLLACQTLRIIFYHLSHMIELQNCRDGTKQNHHFSSSSHKRHTNESLLCLSQSNSFAQYLKEMMKRCEVQKNVLQCLVTSVWHYNQKVSKDWKYNSSFNGHDEVDSSKDSKNNRTHNQKCKIDNYLFPNSNSLKVDPTDIAFIKEILDYNDYPEKTNDFENGFHEELEKSFLQLVKQVMILESRVNSIVLDGKQSENLTGILPRTSIKDLSEMTFDVDLPLPGQPLLNGALYYALQQNNRQHIHLEWLTFVESTLHYSGRFMSRIVLTVIYQLCRNLVTFSKEIENFASTNCFSDCRNISSFTYKHFINTLDGIAMIFSYCFLDRNQFEKLTRVLNEMADDNEDEYAKTFGLISDNQRKHRFDADSVFGLDQWNLNNGGSASVSSNGSTGAIQTISSYFHNIMISSISGTNADTHNSGQHGSQLDLSSTEPVIMSQDLLVNNLQATRQRLLDYNSLNRVLNALFQVWCTMVDNDFENDQTSANSFLTSCCHSHLRKSNGCLAEISCKNFQKYFRYSQSNCKLGWSSSIYTGWYITGSSMMIHQSILTILKIVAVSNGVALIKSIARLWHDLRNRESTVPFLGDADIVIAPITPNQQKLVKMLIPLLNLEYLILFVRSILKPSSVTSTSISASIATEVESTQHLFTSNPFDNIFLIEISLLEFFLAYIHTLVNGSSSNLLPKSWRSLLGLIKDGFALNLSAAVPYDTLWPRNHQMRQQQPIPSQSVQINFQPLINIYLLAIMHEFITSPFVEDRRAQKELQEVAQKLIEASINVASCRLLASRFWTFRRNFEVIPSDLKGRRSPTSPRPSNFGEVTTMNSSLNEDILSNFYCDQSTVKRGFFKPSVADRSNRIDGASEQLDSQSDGLLSGLFNFNLSYLTPVTGSTGHNDLATTSQNFFHSYFCVKTLYAMAHVSSFIQITNYYCYLYVINK